MMGHPLVQYKRLNLNPGELYIAEHPTIVWTVLGSCVAIILHSPRFKLSAIAHAQLAKGHYRDHNCTEFCPQPCYMNAPDTNRFKFVTCSFRSMYEHFRQQGITAADIQVKLFGGANMFPSKVRIKTVGEENLETIRKLTEAKGL
jgi:chemotaxis protein CheD